MKYVCFLVGTFLFFDLQIESGKRTGCCRYSVCDRRTGTFC